MAIGTATAIGLGVAALGGVLNKRKGDKDAKRQTQYGQQQAQNFTGMMQQGPTALQQQGQQILGGWQMPQQVAGPGYNPQMFNAGMALGDAGFNVGQDALMQALRTDPTAKSTQAIQGLIGQQGNPFNASELFRALGVMDQRATDSAVSQTRAGASGLGQRFGSFMARQEGDLRSRANESAAARNAQIGMQSHEAAQQRLLQSMGLLSGNEQFAAQNQLANAGQLQQAALAAGQLGLGGTQANNASQAQLAQLQQQAGMANQTAGLQGQQNQAQLLQTLLAAQQAQQAQNIQLAGMSAGVGAPVVNPEGWGNTLSGLGSALIMPGVLKSNGVNRTLVPGFTPNVLQQTPVAPALNLRRF